MLASSSRSGHSWKLYISRAAPASRDKQLLARLLLPTAPLAPSPPAQRRGAVGREMQLKPSRTAGSTFRAWICHSHRKILQRERKEK